MVYKSSVLSFWHMRSVHFSISSEFRGDLLWSVKWEQKHWGSIKGLYTICHVSFPCVGEMLVKMESLLCGSLSDYARQWPSAGSALDIKRKFLFLLVSS